MTMTVPQTKRNLNGILLVNKDQGLTSNAVLQQAKKMFCARKAGHTGSLDPLATGMLPLCFGEATKFSQFLLNADKCYQATGCLGIKTDTSDSMGKILEETKDFNIDEAALNNALCSFRGSVVQTPSMYSALKHQGRPLYDYARKGLTVERKQRTVMIEQLTLEHFDGRFFGLTVKCSKGTYIRNLIEDIGDLLGVGAHMTALHRDYTAGFSERSMHRLETLSAMTETERDALLLPMDAAIAHIPRITLNPSEVALVMQGRIIDSETVQSHTLHRLYDEREMFLGLGFGVEVGVLKPQRLIASPG